MKTTSIEAVEHTGAQTLPQKRQSRDASKANLPHSETAPIGAHSQSRQARVLNALKRFHERQLQEPENFPPPRRRAKRQPEQVPQVAESEVKR